MNIATDIAKTLNDSAYSALIADGLEWRIKKITPEMLAQQGVASMLLMPDVLVDLAKSRGKRPKETKKAHEKRIAKEATEAVLRNLNSITPEKLSKTEHQKSATLCAGVIAARRALCTTPDNGTPAEFTPNPDAEWGAIALVMDEDDAEPDEGRLWVGVLPQATRNQLYEAIQALSLGKEQAQYLRRFHGRASDGAAGGQDRG